MKDAILAFPRDNSMQWRIQGDEIPGEKVPAHGKITFMC